MLMLDKNENSIEVVLQYFTDQNIARPNSVQSKFANLKSLAREKTCDHMHCDVEERNWTQRNLLWIPNTL